MILKIFVIYIPLFIAGLVFAYFYFLHMIRSLQIEKVSTGKLIKSLFIRLPIPIIGLLIAGFFGKIWGILSFFAGFTVYQIYFLVKVGKNLKEEVEKEAEELENLEENKNTN